MLSCMSLQSKYGMDDDPQSYQYVFSLSPAPLPSYLNHFTPPNTSSNSNIHEGPEVPMYWY